MENSADLTDGARQADIVSGEHAETMFSADQAETNMVKLVDGKLVSTGNTEADVSDDMPRTRLGSDEERALEGDEKKKYENSESALRAGNEFLPDAMPYDPIAVGDITGNPDAGSTVNTGLPSEDALNNSTEKSNDATPTSYFGSWQVPVGDMIPQTPGSPDPTQPVPGIPETPPYNPIPGPEIPDLPGTPQPASPEIQEPDQPDRSHEINARNFITYTSGTLGVVAPNDVEPSKAVPGNQYEGLPSAREPYADERPDAISGPGAQEGMRDKPDTGDSAHPYDVNAKDADEYQPGERLEEGKEAQQLPRELMDESSITAQDMISGPDRSDQKSTDGLDRTYNDPQAARDMAS